MTYHSIIGLNGAVKFMEHHREPPYTLFDPRQYGLLWEECGTDENPRAQLKSNWKIEGLPFTLSVRAIEVDVRAYDHDGEVTRRGLTYDDGLREGEREMLTEAMDPEYEERFQELWRASRMEGEPDLLTIWDRRYLVFACPVSG